MFLEQSVRKKFLMRLIRALDFLFFCRPLLLIPVWTVFLFLYDISFPEISLLGVHFVGGELSTFQLVNLVFLSGLVAAGYIINQIYDRDGDKINGKLGFLEPPVSLSVTGAWVLYVVLAVGALSFASSHVSLLAPYGAALLAGVLYSAPFVRGKDRPWAGLLLNAVPYSVIVWWAVVAEDRGALEVFKDVGAEEMFVLISLALAFAGIYLITTVPDHLGDKESGKRTVAVSYGGKAALRGALGALVGAGVFGALAESPALYLTALLAVVLVIFALRSGDSSHVLLAAKAPILVLSGFECYAHPMYGVFLLALLVLTRVYYKRRFGIVYPQLA